MRLRERCGTAEEKGRVENATRRALAARLGQLSDPVKRQPRRATSTRLDCMRWLGKQKRESGEKKAQTSDKHSSGLIGDVREAEVMGFNERNSPDECL